MSLKRQPPMGMFQNILDYLFAVIRYNTVFLLTARLQKIVGRSYLVPVTLYILPYKNHLHLICFGEYRFPRFLRGNCDKIYSFRQRARSVGLYSKILIHGMKGVHKLLIHLQGRFTSSQKNPYRRKNTINYIR